MLQNDPLRLPPFHFDADPDPDPAFHFDTDPDPAFHIDEDPDLASQNDAYDLNKSSKSGSGCGSEIGKKSGQDSQKKL
jgi:hypothetical protein